MPAKIIESGSNLYYRTGAMMPKLIISVSSLQDLRTAVNFSPDLIEVRIDLAGEEKDLLLENCKSHIPVPLIGTIRSAGEGGSFNGSPEDWYEQIEPWIPLCYYIDLERSVSAFSPEIRNSGKKIISSVHLDYMPEEDELFSLEKELRMTGDIPKIIVTPGSHEDVLMLSGFTQNCKKPAITGVMGDRYRWGRVLCCLFGSYGVFCHAGSPASEGQYHIDEMRQLLALLDCRDATELPL